MKKLLIIIGITVGLNINIVAGPIHVAAANGDIEYIEKYIDDGGDVNLKNESGLTALHYSVDNSKFEVADYLISIGADVNAADNDGQTPIFVAKSDKMIKSLINNGANVNHQDNMGYTLLMLGGSQTASILIENGAEIDVKNFVGMTALHYASSERTMNPEVIQILLAHKVDINATDIYGKTPLDFVTTGREVSTFETLRQAGAKTGYELLEEKVDRLSTGTTNPTDEWPRKMWEIDLGIDFGTVDDEIVKAHIKYLRQAKDGAVLFIAAMFGGSNSGYWVSNTGEPQSIPDEALGITPRGVRTSWKTIIYFDSQHFIYMDSNNRDELSTITKLTRHQNGINKSVFSADKFGVREPNDRGDRELGIYDDDAGVSKFQTVQLATEGTKITGWDFTPPSNTATNPDGANGGGNETANSRLIIKTAGPDIALATDGKLGGAAELQKSNDLRSWRRLGDVPEEASEVLVTPRERGNEFYRLKKK